MPLVWVALTDLGFWTPLAFSTKLYLFVVSHPNLTKVLSCYSKRYIVSEIEHEHHLLIFFQALELQKNSSLLLLLLVDL